MKPARGLITLKPITTEESFAGSTIVLLDSTREQWTGSQAEVVAVGELPICEEDDCEREHWSSVTGRYKLHPCELEAGDWVIVTPRISVELDDKLWVVPQEAVLAKIVT